MVILDEKNDRYQAGGKGKNLFLLKENHFNVPPFVVIPAEAQSEITGGSVEDLSSFSFTGDQIVSINNRLPAGNFFAVRSSALAEDGSQHSFAGQFSTFLYVPAHEVPERIKDVWISANNKRIETYRQELGAKGGRGIAVVVQAMITPDVSGVAFGLNPVNGDRNEKVISAVYGLGEGLVSGALNADTFFVRDGKLLRSEIAEKDKMLVFDPTHNKGLVYIEVDKDRRKAPTLTASQCSEVSLVLDKLFALTGVPQDIEFVFREGKLFLLQTRPVTTISNIDQQEDELVIWDNSNIIESYPGLTSPLTFSFILPVYEAVYRQMAGLMGVSKEDVQKNSHVFSNMLGLLHGRVYYNLLNWYKGLALLPGFALNAALMEKMMGVKERFELKDIPQRSRFSERLRVGWMGIVLMRNLFVLPRMKKKFVEEFNQTIKKYGSRDLSSLSANELMNVFLEFEKTLLKKWKAPLVNDFFAMIYFGVLQKLVEKYLGPGTSVHNGLLTGTGDIISMEPVHRVLELTDLIVKNTEAKDMFLKNDAEVLGQKHSRGELPVQVSAKIEEYLGKFGERCVGELKLETITYRQDPTTLFRLLKSYVTQGLTFNDRNRSDGQLRKKAEDEVASALKRKPLKRILFNHVLRGARTMVSDRENLRYERTRAFGKVREIFMAIGNNFFRTGVIIDPRDIFYLTKEEIFAYIKGTSVSPALGDLIELRKKEYGIYEGEKMPERIRSSGIVYQNDLSFQSAPVVQSALKGIGCCPGVVRAKVRVVHSPHEAGNLEGDILVTSSTDPGWVTLFPSASGILVERGSLLSHSAIVSREMGKPCIVGITGLLERLRSGDEVEMNGMTGDLRIIKSSTHA